MSRSENLYSEKREGRRDNEKLHETDKQQTMDRKYETEAWRIERIAAHEGRPGQHKEGLRVSERERARELWLGVAKGGAAEEFVWMFYIPVWCLRTLRFGPPAHPAPAA